MFEGIKLTGKNLNMNRIKADTGEWVEYIKITNKWC